MPDILQQLIVYGVLAFVLVIITIRIGPTLFGSAKPNARADKDQELCNACGYDTRGLLRCPECGKTTREARRQQLAKLRDAWPTETIAPRLPAAHEQPMVILTTDDSWAGRLLCQHLQARGIFAELNEVQGVSLAAYTTARSSYRLSVWSDDLARARAIMQQLWPPENQAADSNGGSSA